MHHHSHHKHSNATIPPPPPAVAGIAVPPQTTTTTATLLSVAPYRPTGISHPRWCGCVSGIVLLLCRSLLSTTVSQERLCPSLQHSYRSPRPWFQYDSPLLLLCDEQEKEDRMGRHRGQRDGVRRAGGNSLSVVAHCQCRNATHHIHTHGMQSSPNRSRNPTTSCHHHHHHHRYSHISASG